MEKSNQQVKEKERSSENEVPFDTKHTIFVFGDKKLKDIKSEEEFSTFFFANKGSAFPVA